ncbi:cAMP-responsive element modulator-like isoform X2 [Simochromis diagramma]|uniref:cAMP-responsive element modulator-like isoform X2 n=1 Tax=Simochromis diagramma TaxID=43689 RepID=UPI001A7E2540|nr:cAMP-responsive element modulator-like isoform X2 [Simochromis diagramma]
MNQMKTDEKYQLPVDQQKSCKQNNGLFQRVPATIMPNKVENLPSMAMTRTQTLQYPLSTSLRCCGGIQNWAPHPYTAYSLPGTPGDLTGCQLRNPTSSLPQGVAGPSAHSSQKLIEDALQKRELRLMKNREAARECRRKKKEYVRCLENRVAVLENQNKTLIEELRALKDIYRHKVE